MPHKLVNRILGMYYYALYVLLDELLISVNGTVKIGIFGLIWQ